MKKTYTVKLCEHDSKVWTAEFTGSLSEVKTGHGQNAKEAFDDLLWEYENSRIKAKE